MKVIKIILIWLGAFLLPTIQSHSANLYVTTSQPNGMGSLGAVLNSASNGDTIRFDATLNGFIIDASSSIIAKDLVIIGNGMGATQINPSGSCLFEINHSKVFISSLSVVNGGAFLSSNGGSNIRLKNIECKYLKASKPIIKCNTTLYGSDTLDMDSCLISDCNINANIESSSIRLYNGDTLNSSIICSITNSSFLRDTSIFSCFISAEGVLLWNGGIWVDVKNTIVKGCVGGKGTLLYSNSNGNGNLDFSNCTFAQNKMLYPFNTDVFILNSDGGKFSLFECDFIKNYGIRDIRMILNHNNVCTIEKCNFIKNYGGPSFYYGDTINNFITNYGSSEMHIISSTFAKNEMTGNNTILIKNIATSKLLIEKSTISQNDCKNVLCNLYNSRLELVSNTITKNKFVSQPIPTPSTVSVVRVLDSVFIKNNIIANNYKSQNIVNKWAFELDFAPSLNKILISKGHNYVGKLNYPSNSLILTSDVVETSSNPLNPKLLPLGDYGGFTQTHLPEPSGPVVDNGSLTIALNTDQRGVARTDINNLVPDRGSVELQKPVLISVFPLRRICKGACVKIKYEFNDLNYLASKIGAFSSNNVNYSINQTSDSTACIGVNSTAGPGQIYFTVTYGGNVIFRDTVSINVNSRCLANPDICCSSSSSMKRRYTLLDDYKDTSSFVVYPNPVAKKLFLTSSTGDSILRIEVRNSSGQIILRQPFPTKFIDVSKLMPGSYFLTVTYNESSKQMRFIKM